MLLSLALFLSLLIVSGCGGEEGESGDQSGEKKLKVVATTGMIADAAENILGDRAEVIGLMGPGVDPHLYKASQNDLKLLTDADIILYNGLHLEGKMAEVLEKLSSRKPVIAVGDYVDPSLRRSPPEFKGAYDPHIWF
ncbi:MAG: metal ABC transporter solute-binding protein, Zn/Mn family, partial [Candidatus Kapaibacterium sp.]